MHTRESEPVPEDAPARPEPATDDDGLGSNVGRRSAWPTWIAVGATISLLTLLAMRGLLRNTNADGLLYSLISTDHLTFYYWGQGRLASLVPAMASPVRDEWLNLRVQMFILGCSFFGLIAAFVWAHRRTYPPSTSALVGFLAALTLAAATAALALLPRTAYTFVFEQQYAFSMVLYLVSIHLVTQARSAAARLVGSLTTLAAVLVIPATALFLPFAWPLSNGAPSRVRRCVEMTGVTALSLLASVLAGSRFYGGPSESELYNNFSPRRALDGVPLAIEGIADSVRIIPTVLALTVACVVLWVRRRRLSPLLVSVVAGAVVFALGWLVLFSGNRWVELNGFGYRYYFPVYAAGILVVAAAISELIDALLQRLPTTARAGDIATPPEVSAGGRAAVTVLAGAGALAVTWMAAFPTAVDWLPVLRNAEPATVAAERFDAEFVVGDYWQVWPTVFLGRSTGNDLLGIAYRSDPLVHDVRNAVASALDEGRDVRIVCLGEILDVCLDRFTSFTGREWQVSDTIVRSPLIVELDPLEP